MKRKTHLLRKFPHRKFIQVGEHPEYYVSRSGVVWSSRSGKFLTASPIGGKETKDHLRVVIRVGKKCRHILVHRLVATEFIGDPPTPGHEVNHRNGNKQDNRVENLEWVTRRENVIHAFRNGLNKPLLGSLQGNAKLKESDIPVIKSRIKAGDAKAAIARDYGVSPGAIAHIDKGRAWKHVKEAA